MYFDIMVYWYTILLNINIIEIGSQELKGNRCDMFANSSNPKASLHY